MSYMKRTLHTSLSALNQSLIIYYCRVGTYHISFIECMHVALRFVDDVEQ